MKTVLSQVEVTAKPVLWEDMSKSKGVLMGIALGVAVWSGFVYWIFR